MNSILCIETSTTMCSVAITKGKNVLAHQFINDGYAHAENLSVFIQNCLKDADILLNELSAIAISKGPGSYTGLRIGVATAKGLCYSTNLPLIAISTLKSMSLEVSLKINDEQALYCPMLDARRMEVYSAVYNFNNEEKQPTEAKIIDELSFSEMLMNNKVYFFGNGADKCKPIINNKNAIFIDEIYPTAINIGLLAAQKLEKKEFEDVAYFEPFYLKDFIATTPKKVF